MQFAQALIMTPHIYIGMCITHCRCFTMIKPVGCARVHITPPRPQENFATPSPSAGYSIKGVNRSPRETRACTSKPISLSQLNFHRQRTYAGLLISFGREFYEHWRVEEGGIYYYHLYTCVTMNLRKTESSDVLVTYGRRVYDN